MGLTMTIGAAPVEIEIGIWSIPQAMAAVVTLVTESRLPYFEQFVIDRTVRVMTVGTIIEDRRMLPEKGAAPFAVTGVTVLVDARLYEL